MNYLFLKNILETLLVHFSCPKCSQKTNEQSLFIKNVALTSIDVEIICPHCREKTTMHAELNQLTGEFLSSDEGKIFLEKFMQQKGIHTAPISKYPNAVKNPHALTEKDIQSISETLANSTTIQDLINEE